MGIAEIIFLTAVASFTLVGAVLDYRTKTLPNWLTVPGFVAGLVYHLTQGAISGGIWGAVNSLGFSLGGFATGFCILLVLWLIGGGGAGDVKMMGALGAWLGAMLTLKVFLVSVVFIIFGSMLVLGWQFAVAGLSRTRRRFLSSRPGVTNFNDTDSQAAVQRRARQRRRLMPFGVPLALATWVVLAVSTHLGQ